MKQTAQPSISRSPCCSSNPSAGMHSRYSAATATATPIQIILPGFFRKTSQPATGTSTTYRAVMNPALPAVVVTSPICCREEAANNSSPHRRPARRWSFGSGAGTASLFGFPSFFWFLSNTADTADSTMPPSSIRMPLNAQGPI